MSRIRFRISTVLLLTTIAALAIGWHADKPPRLESRIVGDWRHPFLGSGYWESLYFQPNGTFRRVIRHRTSRLEFVGKYEVRSKNQIYFTFEKHVSVNDFNEEKLRPLTADEKQIADCTVICSFDSAGNLLLVNLNSEIAHSGKTSVLDECFIPSRNYTRGEYSSEPYSPLNGK
ncbi:MAG: hypothetical protein U0930_22170 [Pirellulales bacterium]